MRAIGPLRYDARAPLATAHPLAKLAAAALLMLGAFVSLDAAAAGLAVVAVVLGAGLTGVPAGPLARRAAPLALAAAGIGTFNGLVAGDAVAGLAVALRLLAVGLAGIVALATIDPTELADALVQHLRVPARFAIGTLAALRLLPLFAREWEVRALARRARGIDDGRGPLALASFPARTFGLLAGAIRRATSLALAMDARGFGSRPCRTVARPRPFRPRDLVLISGALLIAVAVALVARI
ncbi:MAG TPA: energy-coupling factor transporter transmembrane component T [Candidatus Limnocylindria bacterium]|nr:energy-coupling factor transporter transmembrane component T [Candidatus Limnocylindria bacterium]